jgi:hypothetical protein
MIFSDTVPILYIRPKILEHIAYLNHIETNWSKIFSGAAAGSLQNMFPQFQTASVITTAGAAVSEKCASWY